MNFTVTDKAFSRIAELINTKQGAVALRVAVDGGGCSGFMYKYEFVSEILKDDIIIKQDATTVIIDPISMEFIKNSVLDFIEELGSSYFEIKNPSAKNKCGCGNSFAV